MRWDIFCRVIDNFGDIGVCWRLSADLAARGETVRLWIDDASALRWMAPAGAPGVQVLPWADDAQAVEPGDVVAETFGCDPPAWFVARMAAQDPPPLWLNIEHLSAESYVERSHGLPSPQLSGPGQGLSKWFYFPGFTPRTGGLLREPGLLDAQACFDHRAWQAAHGIEPRPGERVVSLFCYDNPALPALLDDLARQPTLLLAAPGAAQRALGAGPGRHGEHGLLRWLALPWLSQTDYDRLLWSSDLNFVRGEDSAVRAQWAGQPFVWHLYPQHDGAHADKLEAMLRLHLAGADPATVTAVAALWRAWNGLSPWPGVWPEADLWQSTARSWRKTLLQTPDLTTRLLQFVAGKR